MDTRYFSFSLRCSANQIKNVKVEAGFTKSTFLFSLELDFYLSIFKIFYSFLSDTVCVVNRSQTPVKNRGRSSCDSSTGIVNSMNKAETYEIFLTIIHTGYNT